MRGQSQAKTELEKDMDVYISKNLKPSEHGKKAATKATTILNFDYQDKKVYAGLYKKNMLGHTQSLCPQHGLATRGYYQGSEFWSEKNYIYPLFPGGPLSENDILLPSCYT